LGSAINRFVFGLLFFFCTFTLGAMGYMVAGWQPVEALYFMTITIFGVGYEEVRDINTPALQGYTAAIIFLGTGSALYVFYALVQIVTEGQLKQALGATRMSHGIHKLRDHVIICGLGRLGRILAKQLHQAGHPFVVLDTDEERVQDAQALGYYALEGSALDENVLLDAEIKHAAVLATVLPEDADNVFITLSARNLNRNLRIISRGERTSTERKLRQAGANHVVMPAAIGGGRMAEIILSPVRGVADQVHAAESHSGELESLGLQLVDLGVSQFSDCIGKTVDSICVRGRDRFIIVGVRDRDGTTVFDPHSGHRLQEGDHVIAIGPADDSAAIADLPQE